MVIDAVKPTMIHTYTDNDHVGVAEYLKRIFKERIRSITSGLPCDKLPWMIIIRIEKLVKKMLNRFTKNHGLYQDISLAELLDRQCDLDVSESTKHLMLMHNYR